MSRSVLTAVLVGTLVLLGVTAVLVTRKPELLGRRTGGPLACADCGRSATGLPVRVGAPVSIGPLTLRNETGDQVVIERVQLLDVDKGLEQVGTLVVEPDGRHPLVGSARGYPPTEPGGATKAVRGYVLPPEPSRESYVQILFGLRLTTPGRAGARRIAVDYRVGDVPYRAYFDHSMWLCTPRYRKVCIDPSW